MSLVITVALEKGGVGKTATTVNLAAAMALDGKKVLVVDTDNQANSTYFLTGAKLKDKKYEGKGLFDAIRAFGIVEAKNYVSKTQFDNIDIIPSTLNTPLIPAQLSTLAGSTNTKETDFLFQILAQIAENYDYILIDTPPAHDNVIVQSAIVASDYVLFPLILEEQCMDSLETTYAVVKKLEKQEDTEIKILGILPTVVEKTLLTSFYKETLQNSIYSKYLFKTEIRKGNAVKESSNQAMPCVYYAKTANPSVDYLNLYEEIKERIINDENENSNCSPAVGV